MTDDNALHPDRLALDLYAAVLDGAPMVGVVDAIRRAVGADSAWISRIGFVGGRPAGAAPLEHAGFDPAVLTEYAAHWVPHDPFLTVTQTLAPGVCNFEGLVPRQAYLRSAFWNDFARRMEQPVQHVAGAIVDVPGTTKGILALQRSERPGAFGEEQERWLTAFYPHLSRALAAEARLAEAGMQAAAAGAGLDALRQGVAIIAPDGRMVLANAMLLAQAARHDGLRLTGQVPWPTIPPRTWCWPSESARRLMPPRVGARCPRPMTSSFHSDRAGAGARRS